MRYNLIHFNFNFEFLSHSRFLPECTFNSGQNGTAIFILAVKGILLAILDGMKFISLPGNVNPHLGFRNQIICVSGYGLSINYVSVRGGLDKYTDLFLYKYIYFAC